MARAIQVSEGSSVQYELGESPLGDSLDNPGNGRGAKSRVKVLRLVTTPAEGYKLLGKLRKDPQTGDVPIIVLTR